MSPWPSPVVGRLPFGQLLADVLGCALAQLRLRFLSARRRVAGCGQSRSRDVGELESASAFPDRERTDAGRDALARTVD